MFSFFLQASWLYWTCLSSSPLEESVCLETKLTGKCGVFLAPLASQVISHELPFTSWDAKRPRAVLGLWQLSPVTLEQLCHLQLPTAPSARGYASLGETAEPDVCHLVTFGSPDCTSNSSLPLERVCGSGGISACSLLQHLYQGSSFWQCVRANVISIPFLNENPWCFCTVYVSATEILCAVLLACFLPPASCIPIWVTDKRQL